MLTDIELIRKIEFFEALEPKVLKQIAEMCIVREFSAGEYIVRQGESGLGLYFITSGKAKVEIERNDARIVVAELKEGDSLGEFSIIDEKARSANVICLVETRCLLLTRDSFSKVMKRHPEIAQQMLRTLVGRIRNVNERISSNSPTAQQAASATAPGAANGGAAEPQPDPTTAPDGTPLSKDDLFTKFTGYLPPMPSLSDIPHPSEVFKLYTSTKSKTREYLNEMIGSIYAMKAMMRFSMAVVGCPVQVRLEQDGQAIEAAEINGVKLLVFPREADSDIRIDAYADGEMQATFFRPHQDGSGVEITRLRGPVARSRSYQVRVPAGGRVSAVDNTGGDWDIQRLEVV